METYYIVEAQNAQSYRKAEKISAKNLTHAKTLASRNQAWQGTCLMIYARIDEDDFGVDLLSTKSNNFSNRKKWSDNEE